MGSTGLQAVHEFDDGAVLLQEYMEKLRKSISRKRKELKDTLKEAQDLLKTTEVSRHETAAVTD